MKVLYTPPNTAHCGCNAADKVSKTTFAKTARLRCAKRDLCSSPKADIHRHDGDVRLVGEFSLGGKTLEVLKEMVPQLSRAAVILNIEQPPHVAMWLRQTGDEAAANRIAKLPAEDWASRGRSVTSDAWLWC